MKFKQYLLLVPVAAAILFAYCTKEQPLPTPTQNTENGIASDRTNCSVTVTVNSGSVQVCGTNVAPNLQQACSVVNTEQLFGSTILGPGGAGVYAIETSRGATPSGYLSFTNLAVSSTITWITVTTASGSVSWQSTTQGQVKNVAIDAFCVPTLL